MQASMSLIVLEMEEIHWHGSMFWDNTTLDLKFIWLLY